MRILISQKLHLHLILPFFSQSNERLFHNCVNLHFLPFYLRQTSFICVWSFVFPLLEMICSRFCLFFFNCIFVFSYSTFRKLKIMASDPITSGQIEGETLKTLKTVGGSKIPADVTAAMKLKYTCSLEEKL